MMVSYVKSGLEMNFSAAVTRQSALNAGCPAKYLDADCPWPFDLEECERGDAPRKVGHSGMLMEVFQCDHSVPTVGYGFYKETQGLREEFRCLPGREIGRLRKLKTPNMMETRRIPVFAFLGDTTHKAFDADVNPTLLNYPCVITECTFLYPEHEEDAATRKHTHWSHLAPIVAAHPDTVFVLIHFSTRYSDAQVHAFFDNMGQRRPRNIHVFVPRLQESLDAAQAWAMYHNDEYGSEEWRSVVDTVPVAGAHSIAFADAAAAKASAALDADEPSTCARGDAPTEGEECSAGAGAGAGAGAEA